jgi:hypothetical protein
MTATRNPSPLTGGCYCGNLRYQLETASRCLELRHCRCDFCRRHGAIGAAPRDGRLRIRVRYPDRVSHYRFGTLTAETLICTTCGVGAAILSEIDGRLYGVVNARTLDGFELPADVPEVSFEGETLRERLERRKRGWIADVALLTDQHEEG